MPNRVQRMRNIPSDLAGVRLLVLNSCPLQFPQRVSQPDEQAVRESTSVQSMQHCSSARKPPLRPPSALHRSPLQGSRLVWRRARGLSLTSGRRVFERPQPTLSFRLSRASPCSGDCPLSICLKLTLTFQPSVKPRCEATTLDHISSVVAQALIPFHGDELSSQESRLWF